eukprot:TRINITY_DN34232_c0_g1_i1.p1 TRINITY_DN34232_c0_g1~~TRINITY_DN34232_c0_g1_i1.p1  ORF type:complete len:174 (-),score=24.41 TRINITY_DN34232_c0_g1_i1:68-520(-)
MAYGGGGFAPAGSIILTANDPEPGCLMAGGKFLEMAQPRKMSTELAPFTTDAEFVNMMNDVNKSIDSCNSCMKVVLIPSIILWICLIGPILFFSVFFCCVIPQLKGDVMRAMAPLTAKGLKVEWLKGNKQCPNKIRISGLGGQVVGAEVV